MTAPQTPDLHPPLQWTLHRWIACVLSSYQEFLNIINLSAVAYVEDFQGGFLVEGHMAPS